MPLLLSAFALVDLRFVLAGHGYDTGGSRRDDSGAVDALGDLSTPWMLAALFLALVTVALLVWMSPSSTRAKLRGIAPKALIVVLIAAPLIAWTATSGDDDERLIVERAINRDGARELIVSLTEKGLNTLETTKGKRLVRVECVGRDGKLVLAAEQRWPFPYERGYDYPHAHQAANREQLRRADRCRLRGTSVPLEAEVQGALAP